MAKFKIVGQKKLNGDFYVSGAKNAALKMLAASIMIDGKTILHNVPKIVDIDKMIEVIQSLGAKTQFQDRTLIIDSSDVNSYSPDETPVKQLRGSVVIIGPLLSRFGKANFSEPGGCLIGSRPINFHLKAFSDMGISVKEDHKNAKYYLCGDKDYKDGDKTIVLEEISVTTTENAIMASVLRNGKTTIEIAACEPEIVDLVNFLNKAGAKISGAGTNTVIIEGVKNLQPIEYTIIPDRIEVGTIVIMSAVCGGKVVIKNVIPAHMQLVLNKFRLINVDYKIEMKDELYGDMIVEQKNILQAPAVKWIDTRPYPGFPTDLQSPFTVLLTQAQGKSRMFETIFDSRFAYIKGLNQMGANISIENPHIIDITGPTKLNGSEIECSDLRGGAALVIAVLIAKGTTILNKIEYVDRGYDNFDQRLRNLGAEIERIG